MESEFLTLLLISQDVVLYDIILKMRTFLSLSDISLTYRISIFAPFLVRSGF